MVPPTLIRAFMSSNKFRLITRSDFDGLACAGLLKDINMIDDIKFVHPKDMQDGKIDITEKDILTCLMWLAVIYVSTFTTAKCCATTASTITLSILRLLRRPGWCLTILVARNSSPIFQLN